MEMSPSSASAWLPWLLSLLLFSLTTSSAPVYKAPPPLNSTLLFGGSTQSHGLRNCSCSAPILDCDTALANMQCRCHTVPRSSLPPARLKADGRINIWVTEEWLLTELLNGSTVTHLQVSLCGPVQLDGQFLSLLGLQTLRIRSGDPGAPYPDQEISVTPPAELFPSSSHHVTLVEVSALTGRSALKSFSVLGPKLSHHLPHLHVPLLHPADRGEEQEEEQLLTFIY
ncbi:exosomal polycystin-1-interacting protein-like [Pholidichthys leucotaenia]